MKAYEVKVRMLVLDHTGKMDDDVLMRAIKAHIKELDGGVEDPNAHFDTGPDGERVFYAHLCALELPGPNPIGLETLRAIQDVVSTIPRDRRGTARVVLSNDDFAGDPEDGISLQWFITLDNGAVQELPGDFDLSALSLAHLKAVGVTHVVIETGQGDTGPHLETKGIDEVLREDKVSDPAFQEYVADKVAGKLD